MSAARRTRLLVVFDLDETLVHSTARIERSMADFMSGPHPCVIRPNARELVDECLDRYDVAVWTSAGSLHADAVVAEIFGAGAPLKFVWSAQHCTPHRDQETFETVQLKNLHKLRRRGVDLDRVVAIDDSPEKHQRTYEICFVFSRGRAIAKTPNSPTFVCTYVGSNASRRSGKLTSEVGVASRIGGRSRCGDSCRNEVRTDW